MQIIGFHNAGDTSKNERKALMEKIFPKSGIRKWQFPDSTSNKELLAGATPPSKNEQFFSFSVFFGEDHRNETREFLMIRLDAQANILNYLPIIEKKTISGTWKSSQQRNVEDVISRNYSGEIAETQKKVTDLFRSATSLGVSEDTNIDPMMGL